MFFITENTSDDKKLFSVFFMLRIENIMFS